MSGSSVSPFIVHADPVFFREAIGFTAASKGFSPRLIEKDYYCSLLLSHFAAADALNLVFKGGTCLAKIHARFYRLSEDLDFVVPVATDCSRAERRRLISGAKERFAMIPHDEPGVEITEQLKGANESRQYLGTVSYRSHVLSRKETVKIEVALREPLFTPVEQGEAATSLLDPVSAAAVLPPVPIACISLIEAYAEKYRAALTRREVAVRDFFDIDFGFRELDVSPDNNDLVRLVGKKISVPGNGPVDVSRDRMAVLRDQLDARLKPVLRGVDFESFNVDRATKLAARMAAALSEVDE